MANEKDKEKKQKVRCADFAVSYSVKLSDFTSNTYFRTCRMKLIQRPNETQLDFDTMILDFPGMTALRITEEIEQELVKTGYPNGHACVLNFWPIGHNYLEDITPYMNKETEDLPG